MSNEGTMKKKRKPQGQNAQRRAIPYEKLSEDQKAVLQALVDTGQRMKLREIQSRLDAVTDGKWNELGQKKGYSRVRNAMRRLTVGGYVYHDEQIGDGTYMSVLLKAQEEGVDLSVMTEPEPEVVPEPEPEVVELRPNPVELSEDEAISLRVNYEVSERFKRTDCSFYNACLDQAISGKWEGFACTSCTAYSAPDDFQKEMDSNGLAAIRKAVEMIDKYGKISRKRGVKEGTRLKVIQDRPLVDALEV